MSTVRDHPDTEGEKSPCTQSNTRGVENGQVPFLGAVHDETVTVGSRVEQRGIGTVGVRTVDTAVRTNDHG